ncbi:MAG TPA: glycoside hydrolase family 3 N-terminal domain-containing protein [Terrimicrobiaceae bacterium]|nr:glycoside hydrolase family 3 N-terminal domain-containing protein [Terrimicrobiaceae bacterium]
MAMHPYKDSQLPIAKRVADLLGRMTLPEKIAQMYAHWLILSPDGNHRIRTDAFCQAATSEDLMEMLKLGVGQITRPLGTHPVEPKEGVRALNALQKFLVEETRLGIPAMSHEECLPGLMVKGATLFPSALNYGSTWNPELIERVGEEIGKEARQIGCHQGLAPVLDVSRDVRWGRTEETMGEDPYLIGVLGTRYVKGLQGEDRKLLATLKHYVGHSFSEGARNHAPVHLGFKELNDVFMLPFEMAVKQANAGSVMPAYHDIDNEPCHSSVFLLTDVLRHQWGFNGLVVADYAGINLLYSHHAVARDKAEAAAQAFDAGLDIELPGFECAEHLQQAVERGQIAEEKINKIVARVLTEKFRIGLFENPYVDESQVSLQSKTTKDLAKEVALQSVVLLENKGILPLDVSKKPKVAVIGPTADDQLAMFSGYSFPVHLIVANMQEERVQYAKTPLLALTERLGGGNVTYVKGCEILTERNPEAPMFPGDVDSEKAVDRRSPVSRDTSQIEAAVACARQSDIAIVFVGDLAGLFQTGTVGEGSDTDSLLLPGVQEELLKQVIATGTPTIVVMTSGRPYSLNGLEEQAAAVLMAFEPGQEGAEAIVDLLTGQANPSGRLVVSIPKNVGAVPYYYNHKLKSGGTPIAYHFGTKYPFGYGLTYTQFEYGELTIPQDRVDISDGSIALSVELENKGGRAGCEVIQVYVRDVLASLVRPVKELKAFKRVTLQPKEKAVVSFNIPVDMLNFTSKDNQRVVEAGEFEIMVGASSSDIKLRGRVEVVGEDRVLDGDWRMESLASVELLA